MDIPCGRVRNVRALGKIGKNIVGTNLESSDCMCGYALVSEPSFVCVSVAKS